MTTIKPFKGQNYNLIDEEHSSTRLFIDPEFPACLKSISHTGKLDVTNTGGDNVLDYVEWRRPHEICDEPHFVIDGFQRRDLGQGCLDNSWFVAAAGALTLNGELIAQVIPYDQTFDESDYTGVFHFRFWLFGEWNDVVIDDRLPCYNGNLVFCRNNKDANEFWVPLLEKAYAKVCGSYEVLVGGMQTDGLVDFTGGIDEYSFLDHSSSDPEYKEEIQRRLRQAMERKSMVGCSIYQRDEQSAQDEVKKMGLVTDHSFSVTQIRDLTTPNGPVTLVRCLNPWNNAFEWNGDWSDNSAKWDTVAESEKCKLKFRAVHDGEFWMSYEDFFDRFDIIYICHPNPQLVGLLGNLPSTQSGKELTWHEELFRGRWKRGKSAGGSGLNEQPPEKYWANPQYLIKLNVADDDSEEKQCTMIIALMFKEQRQRFLDGEDPVRISFDVYKVNDDADLGAHVQKRQKFYMTELEYIGNTKHVQIRSVSKRFEVHPGAYVIIPNTLNYNEGGKYLLRIFTEKEADQTATIKLKGNRSNLTDADIRRPHVNSDAEPIDAPDSSDEDPDETEKETNNESETNKEEVNNTDQVDGQNDTEPVPAPDSDEEKKRSASLFSGLNSRKSRSKLKFQHKEGQCTIQ